MGLAPGVLVTGSLRREEDGSRRFLLSLAELWVQGGYVDWRAVLGGRDAGVTLPSYAFQRERFWLTATALGAGDVASVGQVSVEHPLLGAALELADGEGWLFTGRLSLEAHPWLADHLVLGSTVVAGAALVELLLCAGGVLGCERLTELTLEVPLVLDEQGAVQIQVSVGEPEGLGGRPVAVYARATSAEEPWTRHASGAIAPREVLPTEDVAARLATLGDEHWPPAGAEQVDVQSLYDQLGEWGLEYGPAFQGLQRVWRRGEETFAEVTLPEEELAQAGLFGAHPALLDAALHAAGHELAGVGSGEADGAVRLPFSWSGIDLYERGVSSLRVSLSLPQRMAGYRWWRATSKARRSSRSSRSSRARSLRGCSPAPSARTGTRSSRSAGWARPRRRALGRSMRRNGRCWAPRSHASRARSMRLVWT